MRGRTGINSAQLPVDPFPFCAVDGLQESCGRHPCCRRIIIAKSGRNQHRVTPFTLCFQAAIGDGEEGFTRGYAEYYGDRYRLTQRIVWDGCWKFVYNGLDRDKLYDLSSDPYEVSNLPADPTTRIVWLRIREKGRSNTRRIHLSRLADRCTGAA